MLLSMYLRQCPKYLNIRHCRMLLMSPLPPPSVSVRSKQTQLQEDEDLNKPIKFSDSKAATWKAQFTREGRDKSETVDAPWYQGYVVLLSLTVFMIHFCILREENDIDEELGKSLYDRIEGLEEHQLKMSLQYNLGEGLDTTAIEARLKEIEESKN